MTFVIISNGIGWMNMGFNFWKSSMMCMGVLCLWWQILQAVSQGTLNPLSPTHLLIVPLLLKLAPSHEPKKDQVVSDAVLAILLDIIVSLSSYFNSASDFICTIESNAACRMKISKPLPIILPVPSSSNDLDYSSAMSVLISQPNISL